MLKVFLPFTFNCKFMFRPLRHFKQTNWCVISVIIWYFCFQKRRSARNTKRKKYLDDVDLNLSDDDTQDVEPEAFAEQPAAVRVVCVTATVHVTMLTHNQWFFYSQLCYIIDPYHLWNNSIFQILLKLVFLSPLKWSANCHVWQSCVWFISGHHWGGQQLYCG